MNDSLNSELLNELYSYIPEFAKVVHSQLDKEFWDNHYLVFGRFGSMLSLWILKKADDDLINRCYEYINRLFFNPNTEVYQLISVTVFEVLTDNDQLISFTKNKLTGNALLSYNEVLNSPMFKRNG
ncbi:hypothetical protein [Mucilaginibacter sp. 44-25]|uniref:DUF7674 family protein n=1 Tax=Mucilaginibacter sp. 44-25 TaxID=1895794 RepID=UPI00096448CD|nr:hypothetical protein [Mucilaginibacter sp. 44-25]OJW13189.1 MAG: hypothetical protein BGO48_00020 [Mucilaginibacter sp. 44-25]